MAERKLASVPADAPPRGSGAPPSPARRRGTVALAALAGLLVIALAALAAQITRNARLEGRVAELSDELATTRDALGAYASRLEEVRGAIARLHALVEADPVPAGRPAPDPEPTP